jgi:DNA polymerase-4
MGSATQPLIAHLDMDAFYASVELLRYPELRGQAVVIGGGRRHQPMEYVDPVTQAVARTFSTLRGYAGRGVITTATYEARALGLHSAMGMMKAAALAPEAILLPVDFDAYRHYSRMFKAAVRTIAPRIEDRGIDEIYIDLTDIPANLSATTDVAGTPSRNGRDASSPAGGALAPVRALAQSIKDAVHAATGLSCSIGVAPNKLLAKIASDLDKPNGLTVLAAGDLERRIWPLPARRINGVGPKSAARLEALGIRTIGDLARAEPAFLIETFGRAHGQWMHEAAHGRDDRPVVTHSDPQSISRETTFDRDLSATRDRDRLSAIFTELCEGVAADLQRKGYAGRTIGVKLRYDNFATVTRAHTIIDPTQDPAVIRRAAGDCLRRVDLARRIRLIGVRVGGLGPANRAHEARETTLEPAIRSLFD